MKSLSVIFRLSILLCLITLFSLADALAAVWTYPGQNQFQSTKYIVKVTQNGTTKTSFVYEDANKNTSNLGSMTNFNHWTTFSFNGAITIEVTKIGSNIGSAEIRPLSRNYQPQISGNKLTFTISKPEKLWIKMQGMYENPLFIFADEPEVNAPTGPSANVVYWGPGVHNVGKHYKLEANKTYYLAGGAYLKGSFLSENNASNITVRGRGILSGEDIAHCGYNECRFDRAAIRFQGSNNSNLEVEGITVINPAQYCLQAYGGDLETHNVKFFGWWFETDGWVAGNGTSLYDSFFKVYDDVVKLYFDNLHIHDLVIYKQHNGAPFQLGWSSESGNDNLVENIDVIYDETNWNQTGLEGNRGFISHANGNGSSTVQRMTFRNINFDENISYLIGIKSQGTVKDFTLENINVKGTQQFKSYLAGGNISGFSLKNVKINGECIDKDSEIDLRKAGTVGAVSYLGCGVVQGPQFDPIISFTDPAANATISGTYTLKTLAYDEDYGTTHGAGVNSVFYQIFDINDPTTALFSETVSQAPFYWNLNTSNFPDGDYEFRAGVASDDFTGRKWTVLKPVSIKNSTVTPSGKPNIWIHTDMTGAFDYVVDGNKAEAETDANSDPDDQVAMAMYLMMANRFNTKAIILGSTTRNLSRNTLNLFQQSHGNAYEAALPCWNETYGGYPSLADLNVKWSSLTDRTGHLSFDNSPADKYDNFADLPQTVKDLVNELKKSEYSRENPLYVLVWGPMTEIAMATKHMIRNNMTAALSRLYVVSHWTSSFLNQTGTPCNAFPSDQIQFKPANCNQNCEACAYMHNEAKKAGADFRFVDVGSVGQSGIVNGSGSFFNGGNNGVNGPQYQQFQKSGMGDVFVKSKFGFGKPDGSDCATFITILGEYGVKLSDFNDNGVLTEADETYARNKYLQSAPTLMQDLLDISNAAIPCENDVCITDADSDGTNDCDDLCPNDQNKTEPGTCGCGNPEINGCGEVILPVNSFANVQEGDVLSGEVIIETEAYDGNYGSNHGDGISLIRYQLFDKNDLSDNLLFVTEDTYPFAWTLNTEDYPNGDYQIRSGAISLDPDEKKWTVLDVKISNVITGSTNKVADGSITIFPNPASEKVYINSQRQAEKWTLYNLLGRPVKQGASLEIQVDDLSKGIYLLHIDSKQFKIIVK